MKMSALGLAAARRGRFQQFMGPWWRIPQRYGDEISPGFQRQSPTAGLEDKVPHQKLKHL